MYTVRDICNLIENYAPAAYQESYDNSGLLVGNPEMQVNGALLSLDITEAVIDDAIRKDVNMIVAHHPIVFKGLKRFTGSDYVQRTVIKAIQNNIALYAAHTNLDSVVGGVNSKICEKIGLENCSVLDTKSNLLKKLVTFVPQSHSDSVREALFSAGAGRIGNYDNCSFNVNGQGTFRAKEGARPFVGEIEKIHTEDESRIEIVFPSHIQSKIIKQLLAAHPYEEVAYDIYSLANAHPQVGIGCIGKLPKPMATKEFLKHLKNQFDLKVIRHTALCKKNIQTVAVCGGSGSFLLKKAIQAKADIFITGDIKYHEFFDTDNQIIMADIGHYESEHFTVEIFKRIFSENLTNFATYFTEVSTNPISYYL